jgi:hypothetical protein
MGKEFFGKCKIFAGGTEICEVSIEEAKYLIYSFKSNECVLKLPVKKVVVTKVINDYEKYLGEIRQGLFEYLISRTRDTSATNKIIAEIMREVFNVFNISMVINLSLHGFPKIRFYFFFIKVP